MTMASIHDKKIKLALSADKRARDLEQQAKEARIYANSLADALVNLCQPQESGSDAK